MPKAIRTDNGAPFASGNALFGLSRLSVWWLRLGIRLQRIKPRHPQQNGRRERMHLTFKPEATKPASPNFLQQQERFDGFVRVYNHERPHQALTALTRSMCIHLHSAPTSRRPSLSIRSTTTPCASRCGRICMGIPHYDLEFFDNEEGA